MSEKVGKSNDTGGNTPFCIAMEVLRCLETVFWDGVEPGALFCIVIRVCHVFLSFA